MIIARLRDYFYFIPLRLYSFILVTLVLLSMQGERPPIFPKNITFTTSLCKLILILSACSTWFQAQNFKVVYCILLLWLLISQRHNFTAWLCLAYNTNILRYERRRHSLEFYFLYLAATTDTPHAKSKPRLWPSRDLSKKKLPIVVIKQKHW